MIEYTKIFNQFIDILDINLKDKLISKLIAFSILSIDVNSN